MRSNGSWARRFAIASAAFLLLAIQVACSSRSFACGVCRREVHPEVRSVVVLRDGRRVTTCCPRCALHFAAEPGVAVARIEVTDFAHGAALPLTAAYVVEGSDETPCLRHHAPTTGGEGTPLHLCYDRCMPSLIAFAGEDAARAFIGDHGGDLRAPGTLTSVPPATR